EKSHRAPVPLHEAAHIVAVSAVPFPPAVADEASYLIETGRIPCLGNQFSAGENRIRLDIPENRGEFREADPSRLGQEWKQDRSGNRRHASRRPSIGDC